MSLKVMTCFDRIVKVCRGASEDKGSTNVEQLSLRSETSTRTQHC